MGISVILCSNELAKISHAQDNCAEIRKALNKNTITSMNPESFLSQWHEIPLVDPKTYVAWRSKLAATQSFAQGMEELGDPDSPIVEIRYDKGLNIGSAMTIEGTENIKPLASSDRNQGILFQSVGFPALLRIT